jgi:hypothetical protein
MRSPDDRDERALAARIEQVFPQWLVMWGVYSRQFWAYPCFDVPRGTIAHAASPNDLVGMMRTIQRSAMDHADSHPRRTLCIPLRGQRHPPDPPA